MKRMLSLITAAAVMTVLGAAITDAREGAEGPEGRREAIGGPRPGGGPAGEIDPQLLVDNPRAIKELGLQTNQIAKLKQMRFDMRRELIDIEAAKERAALKQAELMSKDMPDEAEVLKAVDDVIAQQAKIAKIRMQYLLKVREALTPEQRTKAREMLHKLRSGDARPRGEIINKFRERVKRGEVSPAPVPDDEEDDD